MAVFVFVLGMLSHHKIKSTDLFLAVLLVHDTETQPVSLISGAGLHRQASPNDGRLSSFWWRLGFADAGLIAEYTIV